MRSLLLVLAFTYVLLVPVPAWAQTSQGGASGDQYDDNVLGDGTANGAVQAALLASGALQTPSEEAQATGEDSVSAAESSQNVPSERDAALPSKETPCPPPKRKAKPQVRPRRKAKRNTSGPRRATSNWWSLALVVVRRPADLHRRHPRPQDRAGPDPLTTRPGQVLTVENACHGSRRSGMPCLRAVVTAAVRSVTPSLSKMCSMRAFTVESLMWSSRAISLLLRPCATSRRISISLSLTCESASPRNLSTRREATPGARGTAACGLAYGIKEPVLALVLQQEPGRPLLQGAGCPRLCRRSLGSRRVWLGGSP